MQEKPHYYAYCFSVYLIWDIPSFFVILIIFTEKKRTVLSEIALRTFTEKIILIMSVMINYQRVKKFLSLTTSTK